MADNPFDRLSPRQRQCLRLVYRLRSTKQISKETGLRIGTIDTYITGAIKILDATDRRHAAELLHAYEQQMADSIVAVSPRKFELQSPGGDLPDAMVPASPSAARILVLPDLLPVRDKGAFGNDITPVHRIVWLVLLIVALAIAFGMLLVGLEVLSRLFGGGA